MSGCTRAIRATRHMHRTICSMAKHLNVYRPTPNMQAVQAQQRMHKLWSGAQVKYSVHMSKWMAVQLYVYKITSCGLSAGSRGPNVVSRKLKIFH